MRIRPFLASLLVCALAGLAPALRGGPPAKSVPAPPLLPGEALALAGPDGTIYTFGDTTREEPMGSLAKLVWIKLEGMQWEAMGVMFDCKGEWQGCKCWLPKGHGKVDLAKALQENCDLAFLAWGQMSAQIWLHDYGDGAARVRLEDTFGPFLGNRMPPGEGLPEITSAWVGYGDLLRTSTEGMLAWLMDPAQDQALRAYRRLLLSFKQSTYNPNAWWIKTGTAPVLADPGSASGWAVGGNGQVLAVLHLPQVKGKDDGLERFRAILNIPR